MSVTKTLCTVIWQISQTQVNLDKVKSKTCFLISMMTRNWSGTCGRIQVMRMTIDV